ncbi:hypothetical protein [Holzapfeliella sp. JNUCC 72]
MKFLTYSKNTLFTATYLAVVLGIVWAIFNYLFKSSMGIDVLSIAFTIPIFGQSDLKNSQKLNLSQNEQLTYTLGSGILGGLLYIGLIYLESFFMPVTISGIEKMNVIGYGYVFAVIALLMISVNLFTLRINQKRPKRDAIVPQFFYYTFAILFGGIASFVYRFLAGSLNNGLLLAVIGIGFIGGLIIEYVMLKQLLNRQDIDWQAITKRVVN